MDTEYQNEKENNYSLSNSLFFTASSFSSSNSYLSDSDIENIYMGNLLLLLNFSLKQT